jgi:anti-anti-sigma regulatory factor
MANTSVELRTDPDGTLVVRPLGAVDDDCGRLFRQMLIHAVRRVRPLSLLVDLRAVPVVDQLHVGTLAALCELADDQHVRVVVAVGDPALAIQLRAAGVPGQCVRSTVSDETPAVASTS